MSFNAVALVGKERVLRVGEGERGAQAEAAELELGGEAAHIGHVGQRIANDCVKGRRTTLVFVAPELPNARKVRFAYLRPAPNGKVLVPVVDNEGQHATDKVPPGVQNTHVLIGLDPVAPRRFRNPRHIVGPAEDRLQ